MEKNLLHIIRDKWSNFIMGQTNNIDRLMREKVEDYILLKEPALPIKLGNRVIYIGNFNFDNEATFFQEWAMILSNMAARLINMELADTRRKKLMEQCNFELLASGKYMLEFLWMDKWLKKQLCKLLKNTLLKQQQFFWDEKGDRVKKEWKNCSYRYFKKYVDKETLIQICWLIYFFNFDSQKKSLRLVVEKMNIEGLKETYIPFWLGNLAGLTGKFQLAQVPNISSVYNGEPNSGPTPIKKPEVNSGNQRNKVTNQNPVTR